MDTEDLCHALFDLLYSRVLQSSSLVSLPSREFMIDLMTMCHSVFSLEKSVLYLSGDFNIVGDIHGNVDELIRIFGANGYPPKSKYVFLGDYIDRGCNSVEVILILFILKILYPFHIYLLRGNHESEALSSVYGFRSECEKKVGAYMYNEFIACFTYIPFAAIINKEIIALHGGISPDIQKVGDIKAIKKPLLASENSVATSIVWSDPRVMEESWKRSERGTGYLFSESSLTKFLADNDLKLLIRSHEACPNGYNWVFPNCLTIFSCSDYCGTKNNGAIVKLSKSSQIDISVLPCISSGDAQRYRVIIPEWAFKYVQKPTPYDLEDTNDLLIDLIDGIHLA